VSPIAGIVDRTTELYVLLLLLASADDAAALA